MDGLLLDLGLIEDFKVKKLQSLGWGTFKRATAKALNQKGSGTNYLQ